MDQQLTFKSERCPIGNVSTIDIMTPTINTIDLIHFEGKINNQIINLNSKDYKANDKGFDIYVSVLK